MAIKIKYVDPQRLKRWEGEGKVLLVDVRELLEYREEHIPRAQLYPISRFDPHSLPESSGKTIVFYCRSGHRSIVACNRFAETNGLKEAYCLQGGLEFWKKQGFPTVVNLEAERNIERQANLLTGSLVLLGCCLSYFSTLFLLIPLLTSILLIFSGFVGHRYLSTLLSMLPYNR